MMSRRVWGGALSAYTRIGYVAKVLRVVLWYNTRQMKDKMLIVVLGALCAAGTFAEPVAGTNAPPKVVVDVVATNAPAKAASRPAKISSKTTYYDRKEGFAVFSGNVHVDDERYQMHADKAYVFMDGTNELTRIVALGHVAITNENRRAYGAKASYYRNPGMAVLYGSDDVVAEVREAAPDGDRVVRGSKIKFWIDSEQVEVIDGEINAPTKDAGGLGKKLKL